MAPDLLACRPFARDIGCPAVQAVALKPLSRHRAGQLGLKHLCQDSSQEEAHPEAQTGVSQHARAVTTVCTSFSNFQLMLFQISALCLQGT